MNLSLHIAKKFGIILPVLISLCLLTAAPTAAKYARTAVSEDSARTARFSVLTTIDERQLVLTGDEEKSIGFTVSNRDGAATEVSFCYDVAVSFPTKLAALDGFSIELRCNGERKSDVKSEESGGEVVYTFLGAGNFEAGVEKTDNCRLIISISEPREYEVFTLGIEVNARQTL